MFVKHHLRAVLDTTSVWFITSHFVDLRRIILSQCTTFWMLSISTTTTGMKHISEEWLTL